MPRPAPSAPWRPGDHLAVVTVNGLGAAAILACWIGAALQVRWSPETSWLEGALVAVITVAVADCIWLVSAMTRTRAARRQVIERASALRPPAPAGPAPTRFVSAPRMTTFHLAGCLLMAGKASYPVPATGPGPAGLERCRMCQP